MSIKYFFRIFVCICVVAIQSSCSSSQKEEENICLGDYESISYNIDPKLSTDPLGEQQFTVDSVCSLNVHDGFEEFLTSKFYVSNEKIYVLDSEFARTILVFDLSGNYLYKLGERGRAKNEYIVAPREFFVASNGNVHVFDDDGQKMVVFNDSGKVIKNFVTSYIHSFGLISNDKYVYCIDNCDIDNEEQSPSLLIHDSKSNSDKILIPSKHYCYDFYPNLRTFFYNDKSLSHLPILSDSVIVFKNDVVEKVVRFGFKCGFYPTEYPECLRSIVGQNECNMNRKDYHGVMYILDYQETESMILMNYVYRFKVKSWLYDKRAKKVVHGDRILPGYCVFKDYILRGNQIIAYVEKENVEALKEYCAGKDFDKEDFDKSPSQVKDLLSGKIKAPALFYITIK